MTKLLRIVPVVLASALMVPAFTPTVANANPVDQQRQRVEDIVDELERLEEDARRIGEKYVLAVDAQTLLDEEIVEAEARVAAKEAEINDLRGDLGEMAIRSFVGAGDTPLGPLFEDTDNLNAVMQRDELARVALSAGTVTTDDLNAIVKDLEVERAELGRKRTEAEQLAKSLVDAQERTDRLTGEYTAARADAEAKLGELVAEEEARRAREAAARVKAEYEAQQRASAAANTTTSSSSGGSTSTSGGTSTSDSGGGSSAPAPSSPPPAVSSRSGTAVNAALSQQGVPYRYATSKPGVSFDCSGLTKYAWAQAGVYLPHQSRAQYASIPHVAKGAAQPGDLIFFYSPISHVSVYLGGGQHVHAPNTGSVVKIGSVNWGKVSGVGRPG
ncbi:NlpC/P60 family protein [uncultured Ilumatobacter sp.]|uniref:C40 family peptidase n=1 Tax=uncultured Ilumatobacter sp. TaxID=879968 RepID=UPI00374FA27C